MSKQHYDYFVIGGGSGGVRSARIAASHGAKVGLAEGGKLGGTCVNVGCVPKKLMAYAADYGTGFEDARNYGWSIDKTSFNWADFIARKNVEITRLNGIYQNVLEKNNVVLHRAYAKFIDAHTLDLGGETITADTILIATGGKPKKLSIPGAELAITSDEMFFFPRQPQHAVIYGGGYIALEFAHILHGMGTKVTLIYRGSFLKHFDNEIADALSMELQKQGIAVLSDTEIVKIEDGLKVHTSQNQIIECDMVLSAIGREPNTSILDLETVGIECAGACKIKTDKHNRTNVKNIYAIGDATHTMELTPVAIAEGHVLADRLYGGMPDKLVDLSHTPTAMFSNPPVAMAGMTEEEARKQGYQLRIFKSDFKPLKHTLSGRDERAFLKLVVDAKTDKVLGVHMMGIDAPEILQGFAVALKAGATKAQFDATIGIHPTAAEEFVQMRTPVI